MNLIAWNELSRGKEPPISIAACPCGYLEMAAEIAQCGLSSELLGLADDCAEGQ
jgi:hypothetical protein